MDIVNSNFNKKLSFEITENKTIDGYLYHCLDSTNKQAWRLYQQHIKSPFVVISNQQTSGKGQRGKKWESDKGGLYLSIFLSLNLSVESIYDLTLFSVYGIVKSLNSVGIPAQIKWLNDVILHKKKLGGILWETKVEKEVIKYGVIGVGINYDNTVPELAINLRDFCAENPLTLPSLSQLYSLIILGVFQGYQEYCQRGINYILTEYNQRLYNYLEQGFCEGYIGDIFGVDVQGNLLLKLSSSYGNTKIKLSPNKYCISYDLSPENYYVINPKR